MKIGTLYDTAKQYLPEITTKEFTLFYNQALEKLSHDLNISETVEEFTGTDVPNMLPTAIKIYDVQYNGESLQRIMKR